MDYNFNRRTVKKYMVFYVYMSIMLFMVFYNQKNVSKFNVLGLQTQKFQDLKQPSSSSEITKGAYSTLS